MRNISVMMRQLSSYRLHRQNGPGNELNASIGSAKSSDGKITQFRPSTTSTWGSSSTPKSLLKPKAETLILWGLSPSSQTFIR